MTGGPEQSSNPGPNATAVGRVAAEHLGPLLYALEVCAKAMEGAGREDDVNYYRALARALADAGAEPRDESKAGETS